MTFNKIRFTQEYITGNSNGINSLRSLQAPFELQAPASKRRVWLIEVLQTKRISTKHVLDDLVALLQSLSAAIRSGMDPILALERSGKSLGKDSYLSREVASLITQINDEGVPLHSALGKFAINIEDPCLDLFKHALRLAHEDGATISSCLQRLSRVTRQRQSFDRKVKSALAMQRLSTIGLLACASLMLITQALINFEAISRAFLNPLSLLVMLIGLTLLISGAVMMTTLAKRSFS